MVHPQALVEPMGLPLRPNPQKNEKRTGRNFRTVTTYTIFIKVSRVFDNARGRQSETRESPTRGKYADQGRIIITPVVPSKPNVRLVSCVFGLRMI
jgi:hypothetical protein